MRATTSGRRSPTPSQLDDAVRRAVSAIAKILADKRKSKKSLDAKAKQS